MVAGFAVVGGAWDDEGGRGKRMGMGEVILRRKGKCGHLCGDDEVDEVLGVTVGVRLEWDGMGCAAHRS